MRLRTTVTVLGLATVGVLTSAAAPSAAEARGPETEVVVIAKSAGQCLGLPDRQPMKNLPQLTNLKVSELSRAKSDAGLACFRKAAADPDNPVKAVLDKLHEAASEDPGAMVPLGGKNAHRAAMTTRAEDGEETPVGLSLGSGGGDTSPTQSLIEGTLNKPCVAIPIKANIQQLIGLVNIVSLQDIPILSAPQNQQCTDNSTQAKGDEPLSHILDQIPVLSSNGVNNG